MTTKGTELISKVNIPPDMDLDFLVYDHGSKSEILETSLIEKFITDGAKNR
jgi:hypothetical protein